MPVTDQIKRYGISGTVYQVGPVNLRRLLSGSTPAELSRLSGGYATVDRWEVTTGSGLSAGDYTFRVGPYSERGFKASHRALGDVSVFLQVGGAANPLAPVECLGRKRPTGSDKGISLGPFTAEEGDRMWVVVERKDFSTLKYQVEVDRVDNEELVGTAVLSWTSSGEITSVPGFGPELTHQFEVLQVGTTPPVSESIGLLELTHQLEVLQVETTPPVSEGIGLLELVHHFEVLSVT